MSVSITQVLSQIISLLTSMLPLVIQLMIVALILRLMVSAFKPMARSGTAKKDEKTGGS